MSLRVEPTGGTRPESWSLRLTFEYEGDKVSLVDRRRIRMMSHSSDRIDEYEKEAGHWFELRDGDDHVVYRRVIPDPMPGELEAPSGDPERPFTRASVGKRSGTFVLVTPDVESARHLVIAGSERPGEIARPRFRIDISKPGPMTRIPVSETRSQRPRKGD